MSTANHVPKLILKTIFSIQIDNNGHTVQILGLLLYSRSPLVLSYKLPTTVDNEPKNTKKPWKLNSQGFVLSLIDCYIGLSH